MSWIIKGQVSEDNHPYVTSQLFGFFRISTSTFSKLGLEGEVKDGLFLFWEGRIGTLIIRKHAEF